MKLQRLSSLRPGAGELPPGDTSTSHSKSSLLTKPVLMYGRAASRSMSCWHRRSTELAAAEVSGAKALDKGLICLGVGPAAKLAVLMQPRRNVLQE